MYVPLHFDPCEILPGLTADVDWPSLDPTLRKLIDDRLLETIDDVRGILGVPCYINDYAYGGHRAACGYRGPSCNVGSPHSYHKRGMAADLHPDGMTGDEARAKLVMALAGGKLPHLGGVELGVSWLHVDVRPRHNKTALFFRP